MKKISRYASVVTVIAVVALLAGCLGGGSSRPKTFQLTVQVVDDATEAPLAGALVELVGKSVSAKETDSKGEVSFTGLSGSVEVLVSSVGFVTESSPAIVMNKDQVVTVRLTPEVGSAIVGGEEELREALEDLGVTSIILKDNVDLGAKLLIDRPVNLNLNGKTLVGDVEYSFDAEGELELAGAGQITGDLTVNAPLASVTNYVSVTGTITINEVASETWYEYGQSNRLAIAGSEITVHVYHGATRIEIMENSMNVRVNIHQGPVADFIANSSVRVTGGDKIARATVNAPGVVFDLPPQEVDGEYIPTIIQSFVPGTGGTIPEFTPSVAEPNTFGGLYVDRNHRWLSWGTSTYPEVDMYFPSPQSLGGTGYILQYYDAETSTWKQHESSETSSPASDNFSLAYWSQTRFRLLTVGGPLDGYTSNEIEVIPSSIPTYFSYWGMSAVGSYVGETYTGNATASELSSGKAVDGKYLAYQWYRVDPVTFEMTPIAGATSTQYTTQDADVGYGILFRATGDQENIGGYVQVWATRHVLVPNKAFISDVTPSGFILNLHKKVAGLEKEHLELWGYGPTAPSEPFEIKSVEFVAGSKEKLLVEVDIPAGLETLWLTATTEYWGAVSNYRDEGHPFIRGEIVYFF